MVTMVHSLWLGIKEFSVFSSLVFSKCSVMSMQYVYYQKKVINLMQVIKQPRPGALLFGRCTGIVHNVAGVWAARGKRVSGLINNSIIMAIC